MKRAIVWSLYWTCWALDKLPYRDSIDRRWYGHSLGCVLGIAQYACDLETRWNL